VSTKAKNAAVHKPCSADNKKCVLLATAIVQVKDNKGNWQDCRVMLDSGSQVNFLTKNMGKKLGIKTKNMQTTVGNVRNGGKRHK